MAISLKISTNTPGVNDDITSYLNFAAGTLRFSLQRGARGVAWLGLYQAQADTRTFDEGRVVIINDGTQVYIGTIDSTEITWLGTNGDRIIKLTCVSLEQRFDIIRIPPRGYFAATAGSIVSDILTGPDPPGRFLP